MILESRVTERILSFLEFCCIVFFISFNSKYGYT